MDNELKLLKQQLNRTVYRGQHFTEKSKMNIRQRIHEATPQPSYNHFKSALSIIVCFAMLIAFGTFAWNHMTAQNVKTPVSQGSQNENPSSSISHIQPFTFAFVLNKEHKTISSVIVVTVNPSDKSVMLLSLPPNFQVKPGNYGVAEDLQTAFSKNELNGAIQKVLDIPIENVVVFTDGSFTRVMDKAGGINVNSPFTFEYMGYNFPKGKLHLDGKEALAYFTMLKKDPKGEIGRIERQEDVVKSLLQRVSVGSLEGYMMTHQKIEDLDSFVTSVIKRNKANDYTFQSMQLNLSTKIDDGIFYYVASQQEIKLVSEQIKRQLK